MIHSIGVGHQPSLLSCGSPDLSVLQVARQDQLGCSPAHCISRLACPSSLRGGNVLSIHAHGDVRYRGKRTGKGRIHNCRCRNMPIRMQDWTLGLSSLFGPHNIIVSRRTIQSFSIIPWVPVLCVGTMLLMRVSLDV